MKTRDGFVTLYIIINGCANQFKRYNIHSKYFFNSDYLFFVSYVDYDETRFLYFILI